jgi:hypothetical protein
VSDTIRVITTCTSRKHVTHDPVGAALPALARNDDALPAERLYTGAQHRRLMSGVRALEATRPVDLWVISAKAGLISGKSAIAPYDKSFAGMAADKLRAVADRLRIPQDFREVASREAALTFVVAGNDYFDAAAMDHSVHWGSPTLLFASPSRVSRLPVHPSLRPVPVSQALAKRWSLPLTMLKGELVGRLLSMLAAMTTTPAELFAGGTALNALLLPSRQRVAC